jgi:hypothetical protein
MDLKIFKRARDWYASGNLELFPIPIRFPQIVFFAYGFKSRLCGRHQARNRNFRQKLRRNLLFVSSAMSHMPSSEMILPHSWLKERCCICSLCCSVCDIATDGTNAKTHMAQREKYVRRKLLFIGSVIANRFNRIGMIK